MHRRSVIKGLGLAALAPLAGMASAQERRPRVLLRNAWQEINIGDIAHTLGMLNLINQYAPEAEVTLWPSRMTDEVAALLRQVYPGLPILENSDRPGLAAAIASHDFMLHGSGSGFVARDQVARWRSETGKPYGIFGVSIFDMQEGDVALLSEADFLYFRDSRSVDFVRSSGVTAPVLEFGPDSVFSYETPVNSAAAEDFLAANGLEAGRFMCCIPRYRWTPNWEYRANQEVDPVKQARNMEMVEHDHAPLREAITRVVREAGMKVLICPEDVTQVALGKSALFDPLPEDVRASVVWRDRFWLPDEALATYLRSAGVFGNEMHSPIMAVGNGIPALVGRFAEQTTKGFMWSDIGLGDWLFDLDVPEDVARLPQAVLDVALAPDTARTRAAAVREVVRGLHRDMMATAQAAMARSV